MPDPTLADVAERAGVSKTAVSLILNDRPGSRLSEEVAIRVRAAAAELNYRPNPAARSLVSARRKSSASPTTMSASPVTPRP
jgi:LacI family transcriptional regulator